MRVTLFGVAFAILLGLLVGKETPTAADEHYATALSVIDLEVEMNDLRARVDDLIRKVEALERRSR